MKIEDVTIGHCVQVISGGPIMTVVDKTATGKVIVTWQTSEGQRGQDIFPVEVLKPVK